ncbi:MAG: DUF373 family protein [Candidatus Diapherotrites archaeon]|nr:DUF373 family protein [Candidatus Diapherotrites archaeon]
MKMKYKNILVLCIDRDNDLERKAGIKGPITGRKQNINAAAKLALADPEDSDVNSIFAAVQAYDKLKEHAEKIEVATLTGHRIVGFEADMNINEQLDQVLEKFKANGVYFVTDGAEDDEIIPIVQSKVPIISKKTVVVKQEKDIEKTYYKIKEALSDPQISLLLFGLPGLAFILWALIPAFNLNTILGAVGFYLLVFKGLGVENTILKNVRKLKKSTLIDRVSFPMYIGMVLLLVFAGISMFDSFKTLPLGMELHQMIISVLSAGYTLIGTAAIIFSLGRMIDAHYSKTVFKFRKYIISILSIISLWLILDAFTGIVMGDGDATWFIITILASVIILSAGIKTTTIFTKKSKNTTLNQKTKRIAAKAAR